MARATDEAVRLRVPHRFDQPHRRPYRFEELPLPPTFVIFRGCARILDNGAPKTQFPPPVRNRQCTNGDVETRCTVRGKMTYRAAIDTARARLDIPNDFHGAKLRRAGDRPTRKERTDDDRKRSDCPRILILSDS